MDTENTGDVVIKRVFNAPIQSVWEMWATADGFKQWYGPKGAAIPTAEMDVQIGGKRLICMEMNTPNGPMKMWFVGEYTDVQPTTKLVYTESMADESGTVLDPASMGMPPDHPTVTTVNVDLVDNGDTTNVTMMHQGVAAGSPGEAGWHMAFDKLAALFV